MSLPKINLLKSKYQQRSLIFPKSLRTLSLTISVTVTTFGVVLLIYAANTTVGTNITTSGTLNVTGVATFTNASTTGMLTIGNGFISSASSTVASTLVVSGQLQASSTLLANGLATLTGGFVSSASSTVNANLNVSGPLSASSTLTVSGLASLGGGFISSASSTVAGPFHITGNFNASSSLILDSTLLAYLKSATSTIPNNTINVWSIATSTSANPILSISTAVTMGAGAHGRVGIGTANPIAQLEVSDKATDTRIRITTYGAGFNPSIAGRQARGTESAPTAVQTNDNLMALNAEGYDGSTFSGNQASLRFRAAENWSSSAQGTYLTLETTLIGGTTRSEQVRITDAGNVGIGTSSPQSKLSIEGNCIDTAAAGVGCVDYAELYPSSEPVEPGDLLALDPNQPGSVKKANLDNKNLLIGAVSSRPAILIEGSSLQLLTGLAYQPNSNKPAVALAGRIPVKVNLEAGEIKVGDPITISSQAGVGKKATESGKIVGYALESYDSTRINADQNADKHGKILMFVNLTNYQLPVTNDLIAQASATFDVVVDLVKQWLESMKVFVEDGVVRLKELVAEKIIAQKAIFNKVELKDEDTGDIYCVRMKSGALLNTLGNCGD